MTEYEPITNPIVLPPRRTRYLTGGLAKRGTTGGNGDSGRHHRHKVTKKEREGLKPQTPRDLLIRANGRPIMRDRS